MTRKNHADQMYCCQGVLIVFIMIVMWVPFVLIHYYHDFNPNYEIVSFHNLSISISSPSSSSSSAWQMLTTTTKIVDSNHSRYNNNSTPLLFPTTRKSTTTTTSTTSTNNKNKNKRRNNNKNKNNSTMSIVKNQKMPKSVALSWKHHFFFKGRQKKLIQLIRRHHHRYHHLDEDTTTTTNTTTTNTTSSSTDVLLLLNLTISNCTHVQHVMHVGTGNMILGLYGMRLAAIAGHMDFAFTCLDDTHNNNNDAQQQQQRLSSSSSLLWTKLQGYYASNDYLSSYRPTLAEANHGMGYCPLHYMSHDIRHDWRRLIQNDTASTTATTTLLSSMDEVAIHVRCGDVVKGLSSQDYGILSFETYRKYIPHNKNNKSIQTTTIGIVTAPFEKEKQRQQDVGTTRRCQVLVRGLQQYLQYAFPMATVSIRNTDDTLEQVYARLMYAKTATFCAPSTFCVFPTIATYGTGYIQTGRVNYFIQPIAEQFRNIIPIQEPMLSSMQMHKMTTTHILQWLIHPFCTMTKRGRMKCGSNNSNNNHTTTTITTME